jgi:hypothetical protein
MSGAVFTSSVFLLPWRAQRVLFLILHILYCNAFQTSSP